MNISYNWLKDLIDIDIPPDQLGQRLTNVGLAVEGIHVQGDDFVFDIDLTSNRPDCLSHLGVAREIAVFLDKSLRPGKNFEKSLSSADQRLVTINDPDLCNRFTARIIRNVKVGPSPKWLADRLEAIGERSINNIADITNYVMHELGQPMHAFDLDNLAENRIVVRRATSGETITTLDEIERKLDNTMLAICDADKPVAIAGIMGGLDSSIRGDTVNVLLEVAYFTRENIRTSSRTLGLTTEASYRFERGVDVENLHAASNRAADLIQDLAGGQLGDFIDLYPTKRELNRVESPDISAAVSRLTGLGVTESECIRILELLGISSGERGVFTSPSWRHDISIEEDLVEEIARHTGYENIANELPPAYDAGEYQASETREKHLRQTLVNMGFHEAISYSFIDTKSDDTYEPIPGVVDDNADDKFVTLRDSVIEGAVRMRPTLLQGLLDSVRLNFNHQCRDLKLFELGKVFAATHGENGLPNEQESFALVITGGEVLEDRAMPLRELDFYDAKGAVEAALGAAGLKRTEFVQANIKHLRKGQAASVLVNGRAIGNVGRLSDDIAAGHKFRQPVYVAEINLQMVLGVQVEPVAYRPLPKYPGIVRDVSLIGKRDVTFESIRATVLEQNVKLCRNVMFVDVYEGKGMAEDERSITIRLEYRSEERTLVEDEVEVLHRQVVSNIEQKLGLRVRS